MLLLACDGVDDRLRVEVSTDLVAGVDFDSVGVSLDGSLLAELAVGSTDVGKRFLDSPLVVEGDVDAGTYVGEFWLRRGSAVVLAQRAQVRVAGVTGVQVVLTQSCVAAGCAGGTPNCLNAVCVPAGCLSGAEESCAAVSICVDERDCPAPTNACLEARCLTGGACGYAEAATSCGADEYCDVSAGCTTTLAMADGGAGDAGTTDGGTTDGGAPDAGSLDAGTPGVVAPTFPGFAHFGQYLRRPSGPLHTASAIRCTGDEVGFHETCSNGGEHRSIYYPSVASCADHAVRDTRGFFDWTCEERDDAPGVVFHSRGLRPAVRLADLISAGAFVSNSVELLTGETVLATSAESVWWDTPIERLVGTAGMVSDLSVGPEGARIYWSDTDVDTGGFRIVDDGVSLVIAPGARALLRPGDAASCSFSSVATDQPDGHCAVFALGRNFVWVEGRFESGTSVPPNGLHGVVFGDVGYSRVRHVRIHDMDGFALSFERVHGLLLQDIDQSTADVGFELSGARFNRVYRLRLANNRGSNSISRLNAGAGESFHNVLVDIAATNSDRGLVFDCAGSHTIASRLLIANNDGYGLQSVCNTDMTFTHVTTLNNADRGFLLDRVSAQRATHILSANNANYGVRLFDAGAVEIAQMITVGNAGVGLNVEASELTLGGALITGDNTGPACELGAGGVGILDDTCTSDGAEGSTDYGAASGSDAVYRPARSAQASIYGPVAFDDRTNPVDVAGLADPGRTWWELSGPTRFFGRDGAFPANGSRGACRGTGCRVWIMSVDLDGFAFLSALDGTSNWAGAIGDVVCPAQTRGDIVMTDTIQLEILDDGVGDDDGRCDVAEACHPPNTFLINAFELIEDHIGDDDGLCESNEACRYSPHIGRYQDGDDTMDRWDVTCEFDDGGGPVQGVIMYGFVYTA